MKDRGAKINMDLKEVGVEGQVHRQTRQPHGLGPTIDNAQLCIRAATPSDAQKLRRMFSRLSSESIHLRFHIPYPEVPEPTLAFMLDLDHPEKEFLLAVSEEEEGEIVGHAMYVRLGERGGTEAEMAIVVEDGWQSRGVGKLLLWELAKRARLGGIEIFIGEVLMENRRMQRLAAMFPETTYTMEDGLYHVRMPLRTLEPISNAARPLRRAA